MRLCLTLYFIFTTGGFLYSQSDSLNNIYYLNPVNDTISLKSKGYFIKSVRDNRPNQKNLGTIVIKKDRKAILTQDSLPVFLSNVLLPKSPVDSSTLPLIITVEKLKTFASTSGKIDEAEMYIKLSAGLDSNGFYKSIYTFEKTFSYQKKSRPDFLTEFLLASLQSALKQLPPSFTQKKYALDGKSNSAKSQESNQKDIHFIPFQKSLAFKPQFFHIDSVVDNRYKKDNEGRVYVGYFNRTAKAKLDSGLIYYLNNLLLTDSVSPLPKAVLHIDEFDCREQLTNNAESARITLAVRLVADSLGKTYMVYKNRVEKDTSSEKDITAVWPALISEGLQKALNDPAGKTFSEASADSSYRNLSDKIYYETVLTKKYYFRNSELETIKDFRSIFNKTSDDTLKATYRKSVNLIRTGRSAIAVGTVLFGFGLVDYLISEESSFKKWYNDEEPIQFISPSSNKKAMIQGGATVILTGFVLKWVGKHLLTKAIERYNKGINSRLSLHVNPDFYYRSCTLNLAYTLK